ncbi:MULTISPECIES: type VII secretion-associated protein [Corynebacterium]|jgi:type VII secretion-associated protein, rv3446c family|uniref:type VII secretion-associated protein n=1 Tax=Corynebacterium TaxID=1716 RepID=UPI0003B912A0|nr:MULTISPECIES: type VII secretion-associated protein [Corynebacterium]ERS42821.1 type VII secretion-associated protein [Corynebacterium sp. KPL1986]ERS43627.1 type VII secretion-associated protein [Corynebacterium sp. KPL1996]ERS74707.1 type VII secretion-associated protein [Corynebacterium sp. KPL2004]ERS75666.1 type VII secretion-associated protein [Corynebacterium sp. KPL1998]MCT1409778.1 type VII secretion-associated protein [Corynebacterium accolens]
MSTETPISSPAATITVTVMDAATIFEGPETVYRYDLAGTGIVEGKALGHVMDQIAKIAGSAWPDVDVSVIADPSGTAVSREAVTILTRQLDVAGARVRQQDATPAPESTPAREAESAAGEAGAPSAVAAASALADAPESAPTAQMDISTGRTETTADPGTGARAEKGQGTGTRWADKLRGWIGAIDMFHVAIVVVILAVVGASWWAMGANASDNEDGGEAGTAAGSATAASAADSVPKEESGGGSDGNADAAGDAGGDGELNPGEKRLDIEGLSVVLPTGFQATVEEGLVTATGEDPDLRILLAADSLFNVPAKALFGEIKAQVDKDPELRDVSEDAGRLHYIEDPGDGSVVEWTIWEDTGHHMSVGCHTRHNANAVQKAACRMATESLSKK